MSERRIFGANQRENQGFKDIQYSLALTDQIDDDGGGDCGQIGVADAGRAALQTSACVGAAQTRHFQSADQNISLFE